MKFLLLLGIIVSVNNCCRTQPYLDLVNLRFQTSPDAGLVDGGKPNHFTYYNLSLNLPQIFKKDSSLLIFSPFAERWEIRPKTLADLPTGLQSLALPVTYIHPVSVKWSVGVSLIPRWNGYNQKTLDRSFQFGAAMLASHRKNKDLSYKFGLYYNSEFSGPFFMPLVGIDWNINRSDKLFGVLPGNLTFEHRVNRRFYFGSVFRAITNSYQAGTASNSQVPQYLRIQDNQLAIFGNINVFKNLVLDIEAGHSIGRKFRLGVENQKPKYFSDQRMNDNLIFKMSLCYRLRFRE